MLLAVSAIVFAVSVSAQEPVRFHTVDVYLDSESPVAAWQFELAGEDGRMDVVGVENGDSTAFADAPYFDREAVRLGTADRIIVADFSLAEADRLPVGRTRIATIHVRIAGSGEPTYNLKLVASADAEGRDAAATLSMQIPDRRDQ